MMKSNSAAPERVAHVHVEQGSSLGRDAWMRLRKNRLAMFGATVLVVLMLLCFLGPLLSSHSYRGKTADFTDQYQPPSLKHWFGTDIQARDLFVRTLYGGRISMAVGFCATLVSLTIGVTWGAIAGFFGGTIDAFMMRLVDILYALPFTVFVILVMVFTDDFSKRHNLGATWTLLILFAAIGCVEWLTMARIVRGQIMALRRQEFVDAATTLGLSRARIIFRHMVPNALGPVIVYATLTIPAVMLLEAFLSFLGFGIQPPMSSWGSLIKDGADKMEEYWWLLLFPCGMFTLTLFSFNFLGDGLRDALDVRASKD